MSKDIDSSFLSRFKAVLLGKKPNHIFSNMICIVKKNVDECVRLIIGIDKILIYFM